MDAEDRFIDWRRLGSGAHAVVYQAYDQELLCDVAVKLLNDEARIDPNLVAGMRREVLISRQLRHPNICPIHDIYEGPRGVGIVMDVLSGCDLRDWLKENKGHTLRSAVQRLDLIKTITETLAVAHREIVHRDLKPSNIFLIDGDISRPVIMDFGISIMGESADLGICGTPKYMAPEQYEAPEKIDLRSDLFSLGIMAYEILTDHIPPNSLRSILKTRQVPRMKLEDIQPPSKYCPVIPPELDRLIVQMTAYSMADRPTSAVEVLSVLQGLEMKSPEIRPGRGGQLDHVKIPGGVGYLGSPPSGPNSNEKPAKRVELSSFKISATPITNKQYREFVTAVGVPPSHLSDDPVFGRDDHPVVGITKSEATEYSIWAGGRLPTEAEWERAARGARKFSEYPWGDEPPKPMQSNIDGVWKTTSPIMAHPLGKNDFGLWDMCGNVWEWCADAYDPEFYRTLENDVLNPLNDGQTRFQVIRGGSFESFAVMGRCAFRGSAEMAIRRSDIGFRIVYDN